MKNRPVHENLDTSFVNLSALVRHLQRRQFVGNIRVELSGYEADILLTAGNKLTVREYDRIAGRIAEGEEAMQRLLIRAREPGGIINVFQAIEESLMSAQEKKLITEPPRKVIAQNPLETTANANEKNFNSVVVQNIELELPDLPVGQNGKIETAASQKLPTQNGTPQPKSPLPLEFSNQVEAKARQTNQLAPQDWQTLLGLTAELLQTVDDGLAKANLDFSSAFDKARSEIALDYPFLNPKAGIFDYQYGIITMKEQTSAKIFVAGINETLRRLLDKLAKHPKFANIYRNLTQNILALTNARRPLYNKFSITPQLEKIIGA
ncbi:MAG: hypothetical protein M3033_05040 [Acidobacteriota bacterium]|nr:hypothetical protein [Acidobacteriota bacterium]